jgi:hypothetical protein
VFTMLILSYCIQYSVVLVVLPDVQYDSQKTRMQYYYAIALSTVHQYY